jgi:hypothetical protein
MKSPVGAALAVCWLAVPTVQYIATLDRTGALLNEVEEVSPRVGWDLTTLYIALLLLTIALALRSWFDRRREAVHDMDTAPESGGTA